MNSPFHSLRWRIQAWHALLLLLVIGASMLSALHFAHESMERRITDEVEQIGRNLMRALSRDLRRAAGEEDKGPMAPDEFVRRLLASPIQMPAETAEAFQGDEPGHAYVRIRNREGEVVFEGGQIPQNLVFLPIPESEHVSETRFIGNRCETARSFSGGLAVVTGRNITPELDRMRAMAGIYAAIGLAVWLLGLLGGWWLSGRAIRPIRTISETARRIAGGNTGERIDPRAMDTELAGLSGVLNETFDRLGAAFRRQRQFTADAAHELRTPITILLSETQRLLKRERGAGEYREGLEVCNETARRMRRITESLLLLARQEDSAACAADCDLAEVAGAAVEPLRALAARHQHRLDCRLAPARCCGDATALGVLVSNLVGNALEYGGDTTVTCGETGDEVFLTVIDDGPGIPEADLPHLFERFYRADPARTGDSGHSGLGLAIVRAIAGNHGGTLVASNRPEGGACFEFRISCARPSTSAGESRHGAGRAVTSPEKVGPELPSDAV